jgi:hypothetical protein
MQRPLRRGILAMTRKPSPVLLAVTALAAALTLAACGGGSGSSTTMTTTESSRPSRESGPGGGFAKQGGDRGHGQQQENGGHGDSTGGGADRRQAPVAPLEVSGGGSAQFHVKGGDNSVQDYGEEGGEGELRQAAEATHSLLVAEVRGEWARACGLLALQEQAGLEEFAMQSPQLRGRGCAVALAALTQPVSGSLARQITQVDAVALRHEDEEAFLVYVGAPEATVYAMPLRLEGGIWKPAAINGDALPGVPKG